MAGHRKRREERERARASGNEARGSSGAEGNGRNKVQDLTPEQLMRKQVNNIGTYMKKLLRASGKYDQTLTYQVEQAATTMTISRKLAEEILQCEKAIETETSREGHNRVRINPLYELYLKFDSANRHNLRALSMNRENIRTADDQLDEGEDAVVALLKQMTDNDAEE